MAGAGPGPRLGIGQPIDALALDEVRRGAPIKIHHPGSKYPRRGPAPIMIHPQSNVRIALA